MSNCLPTSTRSTWLLRFSTPRRRWSPKVGRQARRWEVGRARRAWKAVGALLLPTLSFHCRPPSSSHWRHPSFLGHCSLLRSSQIPSLKAACRKISLPTWWGQALPACCHTSFDKMLPPIQKQYFTSSVSHYQVRWIWEILWFIRSHMIDMISQQKQLFSWPAV